MGCFCLCPECGEKVTMIYSIFDGKPGFDFHCKRCDVIYDDNTMLEYDEDEEEGCMEIENPEDIPRYRF